MHCVSIPTTLLAVNTSHCRFALETSDTKLKFVQFVKNITSGP